MGQESDFNWRQRHRDLIYTWFEPRCDMRGFTAEEWDKLKKKGTWLNALARGELDPMTAAQEHFVSVANGREPPTTFYENLWCKYLVRARETEEAFRMTRPKEFDIHSPAPPSAVEPRQSGWGIGDPDYEWDPSVYH